MPEKLWVTAKNEVQFKDILQLSKRIRMWLSWHRHLRQSSKV